MAKIMIVDDDIDTTALFEIMIRKNGHIPIAVNKSPLAIQTARDQSPDLILLDIMMPELSGIQLCKMLKSDSGLQHIPVIMVTAMSDEESKRDSLSAGAQDFLTKPVLPRSFAERLHALFG